MSIFITIKQEDVGITDALFNSSTMIRVANHHYPDGVINWSDFGVNRRVYQINSSLFQTAASATKHVIACGFSFDEAVDYIKALPELNKKC
jgi:hypothetical protein